MDIICARRIQDTDITSEMNVQGMDIEDSCLHDSGHTDGHYLTLFAEQLTRTFE